jgi:pilus assembly protein CpaD
MKKILPFNAKFAAALALAASAALSGCLLDREPLAMATSVGPPDDPELAHPIVVSQQRATMDVFPAAGRIDEREYRRIKEFVAAYRSLGGGRIIVAAPSGAAYGQAMADVRKALAAAGLHGVIAMGTYPSTVDGGPIKFVYRRLTAHVPGQCGLWPTDLASAGSTQGWNNAPYENFGCAYQNALAQEVADPRDLVNARPIDPADGSMRMRAVRNVEAGQDPSTAWSVKLTPIGSVGG